MFTKRATGIFRLFLVLSILALFVGCGGGGGGSDGSSKAIGENIIEDTKAPTIAITSPTVSSGYSTKISSVALSGTATDDYGVGSITWTNDRGGSGTATGTTDWTILTINLQAGDNVITVVAMDTANNISKDTITVTYNPSLGFLSTLQMSPDSAFVNEATNVVFRIGIENNPNLDKSSVSVVRVDESNNVIGTIATLADDGNVNNGDDIASDGVFSGTAVINESSEGDIRLRVSAVVNDTSTETAFTEVFKFSIMTHISDEEFARAISIPSDARTQYDAFKSSYDEEEAKTKTVEWLNGQTEVLSASMSESGYSIWYVLKSGIIGSISLSPEGTQGSTRTAVTPKKPIVPNDLNYKPYKGVNSGFLVNEASALCLDTTKPTIGNKKVLIVSPFHTDFTAAGQSFDEPVYTIFKNSESPTFSIDAPVYDSNATVDIFKTLNKYGIIIINTHGEKGWGNPTKYLDWIPYVDDSYSTPWDKVAFYTGEKVTSDSKTKYEADLKKGRLSIVSHKNVHYYAITPAFITYYNKDFPNSLIYLASCYSLSNDTMASAFKGNGAEAFFGFTGLVAIGYTGDIARTLFDSLVNKGNTSYEAFEDAIEEYGDHSNVTYSYTMAGETVSVTLKAYFKIYGIKDIVMGVAGNYNGSFEDGNTNGWSGEGDVRVISQLGPLDPEDGIYMAIISTGLGSVNDSNSSIKQEFYVPTGVTNLSFDYNVVSEEPTEWVGSIYDDRFEALLSSSNGGTVTISYESINTSSWTQVSGIDFYEGDSTTYMTGWKHVTYDVSSFINNGSVTLTFHTWDNGDSVYDTAVLIDNVRLE